MGPNLLLFGIPVFILALSLDAVFDRRRPRRFYRLADSLNDLSMGVSQQVVDVFVRVAILGLYAWLYHRARLATLHGAWDLLGAIVLYDFFYYWAHRAMHEINVLWAGHAPHHQSEEYNLAVALRQGAFQNVSSCFFFWPMALLGVSPWAYLLAAQVSLIYQFWPHTRAIGRLGVLEAVLNTPSHHRVHHGRNPKYLDKNHGGIFIVWDRLFGTFQPEEEEPVYGTIERLQSWNPLWGQVKFLVHLARAAASADRWTDAVRVWFSRAGWTPQQPEIPTPPEVSPDERPYDPPAPRGVLAYAAVQFAATVPLLGVLVAVPALGLRARCLLALAVLVGLQSVGALLETRRWARTVEPLRLVLVTVIAGVLLGPWAALAAGAISLAMAAWFIRLRPALLTPALVTLPGG